MRYLVTTKPAAYRPAAMLNDFDRVLNSWFSDAPFWDSRNPQVDIYREEGQYVLTAELPGLSEEDLDIRVEGNLLTLEAKNQKEAEREGVKYLLKERNSSVYKRSFVLPKDVDSEKISAALKNGILVLNLPIAEKAKPRSISINVQAS